LVARNYAVSHLRAQVYRHVLLRFSPGLWGKEFPVAAADSGTLDPVDPHRPTLVMRGTTPVFSIPSHDPAYKGVIDSLVLAKRDLLSHADRMIIDVRGNEGGSSFTTEYLEPFLTTKDDKPDPFPGSRSVMMSSDDQIAYARQGFGSDTSAFVRTLLARLRAAPGELVPLTDPSAPPSPRDPREWVVTSGPRAVGVLADGGTVSAGEVLVLNALRSHRATVFGAPTAGALDYQSVNIVRLSPREPRWLIGYPTVTRSADLPTGGMRGRGIPPQVPLDLERLRDPVRAVDAYLARRK
jgi:Peptidase family S41